MTVIFPLTLISILSFASSDINQESLATQLTLVLALAAYTLTTKDWQPVGVQLSYMDLYILAS